TRARAFVLATVGRSVHVPNDLSTELFRGCFRSSYSRCYFSIWFQCFDLGHAAVILSDIKRLDFARVLVKGDVRILQDLAVLMSLRPIQRQRSFTWHFPAASLVGIAPEEDIHVRVKTSSHLLSVPATRRANNTGSTR